MKKINEEIYSKVKNTKYPQKEKEIIYNYCVENPKAVDELKSITSKAKYEKYRASYISKQVNTISFFSLGFIVTAYIVLMHVYEVINNTYIIDSTLSWIIASLCLIGTGVILYFKYRMIKSYDKLKMYIIGDVACFVVALMMKIFVPTQYDFSIIVLFIDYLVNKSLLEKVTIAK